MKKILALLLIFGIGMSFFGCQRKSDVEHTVGFYNLFGESLDVITRNIDFDDTEGVIDGNQTTYTFLCDKNDEGVLEKKLVFYNDVLMAEETSFSDVEKAYLFALDYRRDFEMNFGEKDTYPNVTSSNSGYFDDISGVDELKENFTYYEDYTVEVSEKRTQKPWLSAEKAKKMLGDRECSRIDLRLELRVDSKSSAHVSVKYIVLR